MDGPVKGRYPLPCLEGSRVRWTRNEGATGEGIFSLCWLGIEEVWNVTIDDGATVHLYPCFGDTMVPLDPLA